MPKRFKTSELDFDKIKDNLKDYFKSHPSQAYADYDYEGSGLNQLIEILSYNTHFNALLSHISMNETYLDSAQLRKNVVSRAKLLNYTPRSRTSPKATLDLVFSSDVGPGEFVLPIGKKLKTVLDGITYYFITRNTYSAFQEGSTYTLKNVDVYEGKIKTQRYLVDATDQEQKLVINDNTIDTSTLKVKVYDTAASTSFEVYELWTTFSDITDESRIYFLSENADGQYEVRFGNDVFGKKPLPQNVVEFEYLSTKGEEANGSSQFEWADADPSPTTITLTTKAANGAEREGIESIRFNAPLSFQTQDRAVTATDFRTIIRSNFTNIDTMSIWGGQDNDPPEYGKCFIAIKPPAAETLTEDQKNDIIDLLKKKRVITVIPELIDPEYTYIYLDVLFKYDSSKTTLSNGELKNLVRDSIRDYNDNILTKFDGVFRYSEFANIIDETDEAILNSTVRVFAYKTVDLIYGSLVPQEIKYEFEINGTNDQEKSIISSDPWTYLDWTLSLADEPIPDDTVNRNIYAFRKDDKGNTVKVFSNLGKLNIESGKITLNPVPVNSNSTINIYLKPRSNDVVAKRNKLLSIDVGKSQFVAEVDAVAVSGSAGAVTYNTFSRE